MAELREITKDTDLSKCEVHYLNWDVNIKGKDFIVCRIPGYPHGEGGKFGVNDYYCFPADEKPSYENLMPWWSDEPVRWGIRVDSNNYVHHHWDDSEVDHNYITTITRNDRDFYTIHSRDMSYGIAKAQVFITEVREDVVEVAKRDFDKDLVGRKIWYNGMPAVIDRYIWGDHSIWIVADNERHRFEFPDYMKDDYGYWEEYQDGMSVSCLSPKIEWFPDYRKSE